MTVRPPAPRTVLLVIACIATPIARTATALPRDLSASAGFGPATSIGDGADALDRGRAYHLDLIAPSSDDSRWIARLSYLRFGGGPAVPDAAGSYVYFSADVLMIPIRGGIEL